MADVESQFVSFERVRLLMDIPQEAWQRSFYNLNWLKNGVIEFKNFSVKYRDDTELVLDDINLKINGGEKIGVVGRTGAGKSTLCLCLCRILECFKGKILIDDTPIASLGLSDLRDKITIIPQIPVLFKGTIRFNLDPDERCSDQEIVQLLLKANI